MGQNNQQAPYNENSGGSHRQGGPTSHAAPGHAGGHENAPELGDNQNVEGSFPEAGGPTAARAAAAQESTTTRGGKKQKGGNAVGNARTKKQEKEEEK